MIRPHSLAVLLAAALACVDTKGRADTLYVGLGNQSIVSYDTTTSMPTPTFFASTGAPSNAEDLAFDKAGNLYATLFSSNLVEKFTPGGVGSIFAGTAGLNGPTNLAFDAAGTLYVTNFVPNGVITKIAPDGTRSFLTTGLESPSGLAFDAAGYFYVAFGIFSGQGIEKFTPGGVGSVFASTSPNRPFDVAIDQAGNLYVALLSNNTIEKFTPGGFGTVFATGLSMPTGLAFDAAGNLFVSNQGNNTIDKITPAGVTSVFAVNAAGVLGLAVAPSTVPEPSSPKTSVIWELT
jgi:sugar lactone lactonase YvrE